MGTPQFHFSPEAAPNFQKVVDSVGKTLLWGVKKSVQNSVHRLEKFGAGFGAHFRGDFTANMKYWDPPLWQDYGQQKSTPSVGDLMGPMLAFEEMLWCMFATV